MAWELYGGAITPVVLCDGPPIGIAAGPAFDLAAGRSEPLSAFIGPPRGRGLLEVARSFRSAESGCGST